MITNSVLRLFLTLSVAIIVAGILLIIFMQFDRGYVFVGEQSDFQREQENLINHVYQTQVSPDAPADSPLVMKLNKATVVIQTESEDSTHPSQAAQPNRVVQPMVEPAQETIKQSQSQSMPSANPWQQHYTPQVDYYTQLLRNNPWSPHYKPGH